MVAPHSIRRRNEVQGPRRTRYRRWSRDRRRHEDFQGATLALADDRQAYTLSDRGTYLAFGRRVALAILVEGDRALLNVYAVLEVNPANGPRVNTAGGRAFADFMLAPGTQALIKTFGVERFGQPLFVPIAGKTDSDL